MKKIAIVYMVAGISSRFNGRIKQLVEVGKNNETLIEYSLKQALPAGFAKIIFIVGSKTEIPFRELFKDKFRGIPVYYSLQNYDSESRDKPWGTVDALCSAKDLIDCPFIVCNGDDLYGRNTFKILFEHLKKNEEEAASAYKLINVLPENLVTNRGIFQIDNKQNARTIKEVFNIKKSDLASLNLKPDDLCSMNIFALHPETVFLLNEGLKFFKEKNKNDRKIESLLPTEISRLIENNKISMKIYPAVDRWLGITNPGDEEIIREILLQDKSNDF